MAFSGATSALAAAADPGLAVDFGAGP
ncbi:MAG: hypothetical protein JWM33_2883, partial [Caulobacteraceae bacterium]|nr:hypothetical protein [Caulobacteraceae bacterium]